jgi:hypothetical protein
MVDCFLSLKLHFFVGIWTGELLFELEIFLLQPNLDGRTAVQSSKFSSTELGRATTSQLQSVTRALHFYATPTGHVKCSSTATDTALYVIYSSPQVQAGSKEFSFNRPS